MMKTDGNGEYILSDDAIIALSHVDSAHNVQQHVLDNPLLSSLISDAIKVGSILKNNQNKNKQSYNFEYDLQNDFSIIDHDVFSKSSSWKNSGTTNDMRSITNNTSITDNASSDVVADKKTDDIITAWNKLVTLDSRQKFIIQTCANEKQSLIFSERIFSPWLLENDTFLDAVETLSGVITHFPLGSIDYIFLSLFKEKDNKLMKEYQCMKSLVPLMNDSQKNHLICSFLHHIDNDLQDYHINILHTLIDTTILNNEIIQILLEKLMANVEVINNNRHIGSMLVLIAQQLSHNNSPNVISMMLSVGKHFKGVMRYRINNILKTITEPNVEKYE